MSSKELSLDSHLAKTLCSQVSLKILGKNSMEKRRKKKEYLGFQQVLYLMWTCKKLIDSYLYKYSLAGTLCKKPIQFCFSHAASVPKMCIFKYYLLIIWATFQVNHHIKSLRDKNGWIQYICCRIYSWKM